MTYLTQSLCLLPSASQETLFYYFWKTLRDAFSEEIVWDFFSVVEMSIKGIQINLII